MSWRTVLVLGGISSGRAEYAESLVADVGGLRRVVAPKTGADLARLAGALAEAKPDETLLVEEVAGWLPGEPAALAGAVQQCPAARLVLVSPEVGLAPKPSATSTRTTATAVGDVNQALAAAVDAVVLVVAGQPLWLKGRAQPGPAGVRATDAEVAAGAAAPDLSNLKNLPTLDEDARSAVDDRLAGHGLGALAAVVGFAAGSQGTPNPTAWQRVRMLVLHGDHAGAAAAAAGESAARVAALRDGTAPVAQLAGTAGAEVRVVPVTAAAPIEDGPAMSDEAVEQALAHGWALAEQAADDGVELIVIGSVGAGAETAAAAAVSVLAPNAEPAALLARVRTAAGRIDDQAWMRRCAAIRDAVRRVRAGNRTAARAVLAELAGADIATAAGLVLGAAARRTPVLVDGPLGAAAALVARSLAAPARHWVLLPDHTGHPTVVRAGEVLGTTALLDLRLDLGEGATALATLPLLRSAQELAAQLTT